MIRYSGTCVLLLLVTSVFSQEVTWESIFNKAKEKTENSETKKENSKSKTPSQSGSALVHYEVINGDTIAVIDLPDLVIMDDVYRKKYNDHLWYIKRMYPYAKLISQITNDFDEDLDDLDKRKDRRKYIDKQKELAMAQFEDAVKKMSINEGKYLVKLIHRECGMTAYDVISKYIGGTKTFLWQTASRLGGADLKIKYDPKGDDKMMEEIVTKIEKGEIKVKKLTLDANAVEKKEALKDYEKQKKKEEKKKK